MVTQARQVSEVEPDKVSGICRNLPTAPKGVHSKNKVWPSKLGDGYEADNLIPEKMLMFVSLKENGWNDYGKRPCKQGKDMDLVM